MEFRHLKNVSGCEWNIPKVLHERLPITSLDVLGYSHHAFPFLHSDGSWHLILRVFCDLFYCILIVHLVGF